MSLKGRDSGSILFVVGTKDGRFLLADGKGRPADRPKLKQQKHILWLSRPPGRVPDKLRSGEKTSSSELRRALAECSKNGAAPLKAEGEV